MAYARLAFHDFVIYIALRHQTLTWLHHGLDVVGTVFIYPS